MVFLKIIEVDHYQSHYPGYLCVIIVSRWEILSVIFFVFCALSSGMLRSVHCNITVTELSDADVYNLSSSHLCNKKGAADVNFLDSF